MNNKEILDELYKIGNLPSDRDDISDYPVDEFEKLIKQIQLPLDCETLIKLINLSPPTDAGCFGIEMTMVHFEKYENIINDFERIVKSSKEGEIKNILKERMKNK
jgi:hypothetical protein